LGEELILKVSWYRLDAQRLQPGCWEGQHALRPLGAPRQPARRRDGCRPGAPRPGARDRGGARERGDALRVHLRAGGGVPAQARARPSPHPRLPHTRVSYTPASFTHPRPLHTRAFYTPAAFTLSSSDYRLAGAFGCRRRAPSAVTRAGACCTRRQPGRKAAMACFQRCHTGGHMESRAFAPCAGGRAPRRPARAAGARRADQLNASTPSVQPREDRP